MVILHATTGFGADVARGAIAAVTRLQFEATAIDFSVGGAGRAASQLRGAALLLVAGGFDDELAAARVALGRGWRAMGFVAAGVDEVLVSLGEAREGLLGPAQWIATAAPEPDEGPDVHWFSTRYRSAVGADPPYPAAQAFAAGVLAARCVRDAGAGDDAAQFTAARSLRCRTLYGDFRLVRQLAFEFGEQNIRVNAISAGPLATLAARGISGFRDMRHAAADKAPMKRNITVDEVAQTALFLCSGLSSGITGAIIPVDAGYHIMAV